MKNLRLLLCVAYMIGGVSCFASYAELSGNERIRVPEVCEVHQNRSDLDGLDIDDKGCPDTNRGRAILAIYKNLNAKKINALSTKNLSTVQRAFVARIKKYYQGIPDDKKAEFAVKLAEMSNSHKTLKAISARLNALAESCGYTDN